MFVSVFEKRPRALALALALAWGAWASSSMASSLVANAPSVLTQSAATSAADATEMADAANEVDELARVEPVSGRAHAARNNQAALYAQEALLAQQFKALKPSRPQTTELYALFVAGDGLQEVFRREVEWIAESFAQRFDTAGRAVVLANSRSAVDRLPLATEVSIERALHALAQRMDKDKDLLFVYLTSHGSRQHELAIGMRDMALPQLPAARLAQLLKASGIRQQVVVVSACYSGGFMAPLESPTTWVLTASRADRSSFGCADENDFTYFGRALFKESLPQAQSLSEAFARSKTLVHGWEQALKEQTEVGERLAHSEPQMQVTPAFQRVVDAWFAQFAQPSGAAADLPKATPSVVAP